MLSAIVYSWVAALPAGVTYFVAGEEVAPSTGHVHIHVYIEFERRQRMTTVKKMFSMNPDVQVAKGSYEECRRYVLKDDGKHWEASTLNTNKRGCAKDKKPKVSDEIAKIISTGGKLKDIEEEYLGYFMVNKTKITGYWCDVNGKPRTKKPKVIYVWCPTCVGKTRFATQLAAALGGTYYIKDSTQWWDGYTFNDVIIIDDFDGHWPFRDLLCILDRYKYRGQYKGGYVNINSPFIVITCDRPLDQAYNNPPLDAIKLAQLKRRVDILLDADAPLMNLEEQAMELANRYEREQTDIPPPIGPAVTAARGSNTEIFSISTATLPNHDDEGHEEPFPVAAPVSPRGPADEVRRNREFLTNVMDNHIGLTLGQREPATRIRPTRVDTSSEESVEESDSE
ncbi:hypothetical protein WA158_003499 [Blastocystis sp. Blastoise]